MNIVFQTSLSHQGVAFCQFGVQRVFRLVLLLPPQLVSISSISKFHAPRSCSSKLSFQRYFCFLTVDGFQDVGGLWRCRQNFLFAAFPFAPAEFPVPAICSSSFLTENDDLLYLTRALCPPSRHQGMFFLILHPPEDFLTFPLLTPRLCAVPDFTPYFSSFSLLVAQDRAAPCY